MPPGMNIFSQNDVSSALLARYYSYLYKLMALYGLKCILSFVLIFRVLVLFDNYLRLSSLILRYK